MSDTKTEAQMGIIPDESPTLGKLADALAKAQGAMKPAPKDSSNPFFNSKYADLASVWSVIREPLAANGLSVVQRLGSAREGVVITTQLMHASGEWVRDRLFVPVVQTESRDGKKQAWIQAFGSAVTYARRYALSAIVGVAADEDDDGNAAAQYSAPKQARPPQQSAAPRQAAPHASPESLVGKVRFGKKKGVPLSDLDDDSLAWYANKIAGSNKPDDVAMSGDIESEWTRRRGQNGHGSAVTQ